MQKKEDALHSDDLAAPSAGHAILQGEATMLKSGCASAAQIGVRDNKTQHDGAAQRDKPGGEIIGLSGDQLSEAFNAMGVPNRQISMRRAQIWRWLYCQGVTDFDDMQNISKGFRQDLADYFIFNMPEIVSEQISQDGTIKWLLRFALKGVRQAVEVETVYIPEPERGTLCVSSQAGCTLNCSFCHTGTQNLVRNLTAGEIVAQILYARRRLASRAQELTGTAQELTGQAQELSGKAQEENPSAANSALPITNIVMMGMGEPLYNFDNVKQALDIVADGAAIAVSKRRITLSTAGVVPRIADVGNQIKCLLAISLHAVRDEIRDELVPINRKWPIEALLEACRTFPGVCNARRITFEYVMLKNVNDSLAEARELTRLIRHIPAKVNLIPFNPWPGTRYQTSDWEQIEAFGRIVNDAGYAAPIRMPRGRDIFAACGQLRTDSIRQRLREKIKEDG